MVAKEVFEKQPAFPDGLNLLADLPKVRQMVDAASRHAEEHSWDAQWAHEARHSSGTVTAKAWDELVDSIGDPPRRDLISLHSLLVPKGEHYSTTPVFILRLEAPGEPANSRCWVRATSETETLGLVSRIEELAVTGGASTGDHAEGATGQGGAAPDGSEAWYRAGQLFRRLVAFARGLLGS